MYLYLERFQQVSANRAILDTRQVFERREPVMFRLNPARSLCFDGEFKDFATGNTGFH